MSAGRAAEAAGAADVARWRGDPSLLGTLALGAFDEAPRTEVALRRLLLALRVPPRLVLVLTGPERFQRAVATYAYWCGVRRAVERETWRQLTQGTTILMYHAFALGGERPSRFVITRGAFERQMRWLARRRPVLGLDDLVAY